ncbi:MAG: class I SAM-dependent methyltransferase [Actinomycetota bacterium]|nr:class I SAM-dependent methyltransferase [Actinomycetota bacterium]
MGGELETLPATEIEDHVPSVGAGPDHPMRVMTRRAAGLEGPPWDDEAVATVVGLFDRLAPEWHTRTSAARTAVVADALERGGVDGAAATVALEVGSGIGAYSGLLSERFGRTVSVDLSSGMLRLAPPDASHRVRADASRLPVGADSVDAVVLVNMFLFPGEVDRVLRPDGALVWVNSSGPSTPIHLRADEVARALPGRWTGVESRAGVGTWTVLRRA